MTARLRVLLALLVLSLLSAAASFVVSWLFEPVDERVDRGFHGEAAVNPLLALERFLEGMGVPAVGEAGFARLPGEDHLLVVAAPRRNLGPVAAERLLSWAERGGHLLVVPTPRDLGDALLGPLDVVVLRPEDEDAAPTLEALASGSEPPVGPEPPPAPPRLLHFGDPAQALPQPWPLGDELLVLQHGSGRVSVLADGRRLSNEQLGEDQNAELAWALVSAGGAPAGARLVHRDRRPSPWALLAGRAAPVAWALAALSAAALWKAAARFGPLIPPEAAERRSLAEHVRASGHWLWSRGASRALIDATRAALHRRLARGQDGPLEELASRAAAEHGLEDEAVRRALASRAPAEAAEFTRVVRVLESLRRDPR